MRLSSFLGVLLILFFLSPVLILVAQFSLNLSADWQELFWALKNTFYQAAGSTLLAMIFATLSALGLLYLERTRWSFLLSSVIGLLILPSLIPSLFVLISLFHMFDPFPMGLVGIVIAHAFIYYGVSGVALYFHIKSSINTYAEIAYLSGATKWTFWRRIAGPLLKTAFTIQAFVIFVASFASFSIPLVVGGGKGTTLEVLIYEKIRIGAEWSDAILIALIQMLLLFLVSLPLQNRKPMLSWEQKSFQKVSPLMGSSTALILMMVPALGIVISYFWGVIESLSMISLSELSFIISSIHMWGTLWISLFTSLLLLALYAAILVLYKHNFLKAFLYGYVAPSSALTSFAYLVFGSDSMWITYFKIPLVLTLLLAPMLYKLVWEPRIKSLESQRQMAWLLGSSDIEILKRIQWPQSEAVVWMTLALAIAWSAGDFAVSRMLSSRELSMGMLVDTLMSGYRIHLATVASALLIGVILLLYFLVKGVYYVSRKKSA